MSADVPTIKDVVREPNSCLCGGKIIDQGGKGVCENCGAVDIPYN